MSVNAIIQDHHTRKRASVTEQHALRVAMTHDDLPPAGSLSQFRLYKYALSGLNVDGSVTAQTFSLTAEQDYDLLIQSAVVVITGGNQANNKFGSLTALTNGFDLYFVESGIQTYLYEKVKTNGRLILESGLHEIFGSTSTINQLSATVSNNDSTAVPTHLSDYVPGGVRLGRGTQDRISVQINDNLSGLAEFYVLFFGSRQVY